MLSLGKAAGLDKVPLPGQFCVGAGHWGRWGLVGAPRVPLGFRVGAAAVLARAGFGVCGRCWCGLSDGGTDYRAG